LILTQKIIFCHLLSDLSEMDLSVVLTPALFDYHWLRRALHGALHCSCVAVVYPNLELICDFRPSKFSQYPSRPVPLPGVFVTTRPDPVPKSKTTTRQSLLLSKSMGLHLPQLVWLGGKLCQGSRGCKVLPVLFPSLSGHSTWSICSL